MVQSGIIKCNGVHCMFFSILCYSETNVKGKVHPATNILTLLTSSRYKSVRLFLGHKTKREIYDNV